MARQNGRSAGFVGETGPGAVIDQYLPQPGQHVGRRVLKVEDIPAEYFRDSATSSGIQWSEYLGLEKKEGVWDIARPEVLTARWFERYSQVRQVQPSRLSGLQARISAEARGTLATQGSLVSWSRGTSSATARGSSAPDHTGATEPQSGPEIEDPRGSGSGAVRPEPEEEAPGRFSGSILHLAEGPVRVSTQGWGGIFGETEVDVEAPPEPALFIVQVVGISSFLGDYGLGKTVKTFTLLPGEVTNIHTRTWRATEDSRKQSTSIIDSYDENSAERFAETVLNETTDKATQEKTENWHVEAEAKGSIGIASASVSGGGGGEYTSGTEEFARSVGEAVREHTAEASSHRENTVTSSSESSVSTEQEEVIERTIKNINVSRVLNFTWRELNQKYETRTHLKDIRIAFSNGNAESWREAPVSGLRQLVEEFVLPQHVEQVCSDMIETIALVRNVDEPPVPVLDQVTMNPCRTNFQVRDAVPNDDCTYPAPTQDGRLYYRFKRGPLAQGQDPENPVDGVVLSERTVVMATDSVVVEALLGVNNALDAYSEGLQLEAVREKRLANAREELAQRLVRGGRDGEADIFQQVFGVGSTADADAGVEEEVAV